MKPLKPGLSFAHQLECSRHVVSKLKTALQRSTIWSAWATTA